MALWPAQKRRSGAQDKETRRKDHELAHYNTISPRVHQSGSGRELEPIPEQPAWLDA